MNSKDIKTAFCLFEVSGTFKDLLSDAGYNAIGVDIQNGIDILKWDYKKYENVDVVISHPPCTEFAVSGACWWKSKPPWKLEMAIKLVKKTIEIINYHNPRVWFIENPVGRIESCVPEMKRFHKWWFHPHWFANYADEPNFEAYTKKTILWGQYAIPRKDGLEAMKGTKTHHSQDLCIIQSGADLPTAYGERNKLRSKTPQGFARAFIQAQKDFKPSPKQLTLFESSKQPNHANDQ